MKDAEIEQRFLDFVFTTDAEITPAALAFYARCPIHEAAALLERLVDEGTLRLDSDEHGELTYVYPRRSRIASPVVASSAAGSRRACAACGRPVPPDARACAACGTRPDDGPRGRALVPATTAEVARGYPVDPGAAAVLSIWPGAGHIYAGRLGAGIGWMLATPIGYMLLIVPGIVLHLLCIVSAVHAARETNLRGGL